MPWRTNCASERRKTAPSGNPRALPPPRRAADSPSMARGNAARPVAGNLVREVFLTLPGLNLDPARLDPLRSILHSSGAATLAPALAGYAKTGPQELVSARQWMGDLTEAHQEARFLHPGAAISMLGFSIGAALGLVWCQMTGNAFDRVVLVAPALGLRPLTRLGLLALSSLPSSWMIPSAGPRDYQWHRATSVNHYRAAQYLMVRIASGPGPRPRASFTAVSPKDELISPEAARLYVQACHDAGPAGAHKLHWIEHRPRFGWPRHLTLDATTLGETHWNSLRSALLDWLAATAPEKSFPPLS